jgi:hypothetical protein
MRRGQMPGGGQQWQPSMFERAAMGAMRQQGVAPVGRAAGSPIGANIGTGANSGAVGQGPMAAAMQQMMRQQPPNRLGGGY